MTKTLTKPFVCALNLLALVFTFGSAYAGSADYSKDKAIVQPAPVCDPRWYISIGGGLDLDYQATNFVNGTNFEPYAGNPTDQIRLGGHTYDSVFGDTLYRIQGELGYVLNDHIELFGLFKYAGGYGDTFGDIDYETSSSYPIKTYFGEYRSWGGELGLRWFFFPKQNEAWHVRPYVSISGGATFVQSISVDSEYSYGTNSYLPAFKGNLYDDSIVGTGALMIGLEVPINCHWSFGVEGGVRYESKLDSTDVIRRTFGYYDTNPALLGSYNVSANAANYNDAGDRLYFPANIYLKFRF